MEQNESVSVPNAELEVTKATQKMHQREIEIFTEVQNIFLNGFSSIPTFEYKDESEYICLLILIRTLNSIRCSIELMMKGYYSQSMSILRTITEDWFICGTVKENVQVRDCLIRDKKMPHYKDLAIQMNALNVYEGDYHYQSQFTHSSRLSLRVLYDLDNNVAKVAPSYDESLFLLCAESLMRVSILMCAVFATLLTDLDKEKAQSWSENNIAKLDSVTNWLGELREKYGGNSEE